MAIVKGTAGADTLRGTSGADTISGSGGNDTITALGGADKIDAGAGNDRIKGGPGADEMFGGSGADVFVYRSVADSPFNANYTIDWIRDWESIDTIDLSAIDANSTIAGNQAFNFVGYSYGTPVGHLDPGELAIAGFGGELYIVANTDTDDAWDFAISLWSSAGEMGLTSGDLIL